MTQCTLCYDPLDERDAVHTPDGVLCPLCEFYLTADLDDLWDAACKECGEIHLGACARREVPT